MNYYSPQSNIPLVLPAFIIIVPTINYSTSFGYLLPFPPLFTANAMFPEFEASQPGQSYRGVSEEAKAPPGIRIL